MKKLFILLFAVVLAFVLVGCQQEEQKEIVMSYAEYQAAELDSEVVVETYIQAKQSWWDGKGTFYTQNEEGAYFLYNMPCTEEEYKKLVPGTKIQVKGFKSEWAGEVEITDATYKIIEGEYIAKPKDLTAKLASEELVNYQNQLATFKGLTVEGPAMYKWDNSGERGDDLYINLFKDGISYSFTVESYLYGKDTQVYKDVEALKAGDIIDVECFLYWYNGANPHMKAVEVKGDAFAKVEGAMSHEQFMATENDEAVTIAAFIQAKQGWWEDKGVGVATFYLQAQDGAFFAYNLPCSQEDYNNKLVIGAKVKITGVKAEWSGEVEIVDGEYELLAGNYLFKAEDLTNKFGDENLVDYENIKFKISKAVIKSAALYKWDGSGKKGDDLYFDVTIGGKDYTFTVESYLCGAETEVYKAVEGLKVGDVVDLEGFLYWYNGPNPHITSCKVIPASEE